MRCYDMKAYEESGSERYPLLQYAYKYWWHYAVALCCDKDQRIVEASIKKLTALLIEFYGTALILSIGVTIGFKGNPSNEVFSSVLNDWLKDLDGKLCMELTFDFKSSLPRYSVSMGEEALVSLTLGAGPTVNQKGRHERTALHSAAEKKHKADFNVRDKYEWTPLLWAAANGREAVLRLLLRHKADVNVKDNHGRTPLSWAAGNGHEIVAQLLLEHKADVNVKAENGWTPLLWAAGNGHEAVVRLLLGHKADVDVKTESGWTPLLWAARNGHEKVMRLLLAHKDGVGSSPKDAQYGEMPLSLAAYSEHETEAKLLQSRDSLSDTWAVLIGIDHYPPGGRTQRLDTLSSLNGCVEDILDVERYLKETIEVRMDHIIKLLAPRPDRHGALGLQDTVEDKPTYSNIIHALKSITIRAKPGDMVYIHYSGHAVHAPTVFQELKGVDARDDAFVPTDFASGGPLLRDLELGFLLQQMVDKGLVVTMVLDCVNTGGWVLNVGNSMARGIKGVDKSVLPRDLPESFQEIEANVSPHLLRGPRGFTLFAACQPNQVAYEYTLPDGRIRGAFTYWLLRALQESPSPTASSQMLCRRVCAGIQGDFSNQTPLLTCEDDRLFFGAGVVSPDHTLAQWPGVTST
jgi:ankyrin repeat protein